jgi:hypothetical protein
MQQWNPFDLPKWLDEDFYQSEILPRLSEFTVKTLRFAVDVSHPYATLVKRGLKIPHPRHWMPLAALTGVTRAQILGATYRDLGLTRHEPASWSLDPEVISQVPIKRGNNPVGPPVVRSVKPILRDHLLCKQRELLDEMASCVRQS